MLRKKLRRHGDDKLIKRLNVITLITWAFSIITLYMIFFARPPVESVFYKWHKTRLGGAWDEFMLQNSIFFMVICFILSITGLVINKFRHKRKTDKYRVSLIILAILSLVGIIFHISVL